jgi:hypothetical protein
MVKRMAYMLGVLGSSDAEKPSRLRLALQITLVGAVVLVGLVLPLVWVPYMALAFRKSGLRMGAQASAFYAERRSEDAGVTVRSAPRVGIAMPILVAVIAVLTGADVGSGKWVSARVFLIVVFGLATLAWFGYRWWRLRCLRAPVPVSA